MMKLPISILFMLFIFLSSCRKEEIKPDDQYDPEEVIIAEETKVLNNTIRSEIQELDTTDFTFHFSQGSSFAGEIKENDILVDSASSLARYGFLRKVTSVGSEGGSIVINTSQAALEDVIRQGSIDLHSASLTTANIDHIVLAEGFSLAKDLKSTELLGFDMNFEHNIDGNQNAIITGSVYFDLDFNFDLDICLKGVKYFKASVEVDEAAALGLEVTSDFNLKEEIVFAQITFTPWTVMIGIVPVVFVPKVELVMNSDLTVTGTLKTYATQNYNREIGLDYDKDRDDEKWSKINSTNPPPGYSLLPAALTDNVDYIVKVGPKASLKLYGIAGPYVDLLLVSDLGAEKSPNGFNMDYDLNLESNAGVEIDVLFVELEKNFQLFNVNLVHDELNDEPLYQSFTIEHPVDGAKVNIGEILNIGTYLTGAPPSEVRFYVDDILIYTDTDKPFEHAWTVEGSTGLHTIKAIADYGGSTIISEIDVTFQMGGWQQIDVSGLFESDYCLECIGFSDAQNGWILGRTEMVVPVERFCLHSGDGGKTWSKIYSGEAGYAYPADDFLVLGEDIAFFTAGGDLYQTLNGGTSWNTVPIPDVYPYHVEAYHIEVNENGNIYALGREMYRLQSGESGEWELVADYQDQADFEIISVIGMSFPVDHTGFMLGSIYNESTDTYTGGLFKSTDGGAHWTCMNIDFDQSEMDRWDYEDIFFINNNIGWIIGFTGRPDNDKAGYILKTTDGGSTWSTQLMDHSPTDIHFLETATGYLSFVSYPEVIIGYTDDGGDNWYLYDTPFDITHHVSGSLFFLDQNHGWYVQDKIILRYALAGE